MGVRMVPHEIEGETGLDVVIDDQDATVADLVAALQIPADDPTILKPHHKQRYHVCRGCINNCCKHNYIVIDLVAAERLAVVFGLTLNLFAKRYLSLAPDILFPELKRRPCPFLEHNICTVYDARALICRLYLCTPMTDRLEKLRCAVLFAGEAALRQRLVELGIAPSNWRGPQLERALRRRYQDGQISAEKFASELAELELLLYRNPFRNGRAYHEVLLRDCCTPALWHFINT